MDILKRFSPSRFSGRHVLVDGVLILTSLYFSLWLRLGEARLDDHLAMLNHMALAFVAIRVITFLGFGVYQSLWRYISTFDATRLALAVLVSLPLNVSLTYLANGFGFLPRAFFLIDAFVCPALLMSVRLLRRRLFERRRAPQTLRVSLGKLIIYGAGKNGRLLAQRMLGDPHRDRELLGFVDDDPQTRDKMILGLPVLGEFKDLETVIVQLRCTELVVAITAPRAERMRDLVLLGRKLGVRVQRISGVESVQGALYQQVELKDLLSRPSSQVDLPSVQSLIKGKVVLVTGAGGSIGAELSRQIARFSPAKLLLLDHAEYNLYEIDRELRPATGDFARVVPLLVDMKDEATLRHMFAQYKPQVVFHAAAYKHVHLVEANVASSVLNNVKSTWNLLRLCEQFATERFVLVSSDKAVNPVGVMGATKRVCEILTTAMGEHLRKPFSAVRFGNVLGSSGSLVPLLSKQIEEGGPVTITHPDMTRYFMLIPEAVALILISATMSKPGDINVLRMGEPIAILELAKSLMALMGRADGEIAIAFTGIRPGEKMFEELYLTGSEVTTRHPDILTLPSEPHSPSLAQVGENTATLLQLAERGDADLGRALQQWITNPRLGSRALG